MSSDPVPASENHRQAVDHAVLSDVGLRRANNQDAVIALVTDCQQGQTRGHLFMVADGMGAHAAGELASQMAVEVVPQAYAEFSDTPPATALRQAVQRANRQIHTKGQSAHELKGMGTTCSCLLLLPHQAIVAHVGDSRVYRLRGQTLEQLTFDHSLVWELAAASQMPAGEVPASIPKNVITRSLGPQPEVPVDVEGPFEVLPQDKYLVCSDGLTGVVQDEFLAGILHSLPPHEAVATLVDLTNLCGGPDNVSVAVVEIAPQGSSPQGSSQQGSLQEVAESIASEKMADHQPLPTEHGISEAETSAQVSPPIASPAAASSSTGGQRWWSWFTWWRSSQGAVAAAPPEEAPRELSPESTTRYGRGPYRQQVVSPETSARQLGKLLADVPVLRAAKESLLAAVPEQEWLPIEQHYQWAEQAMEQGNFSAAIVSYAATIRGLMTHLRPSLTKPT